MPEASNIFEHWAHLLLVWVGFGTLVGLVAKAVLPGKDPGGAFATVVMGVLGSIIGAGILLFFSDNLRVTPVSPAGFVVAIAGTALLLSSYRLISGAGFRFGMPGFNRRKRRISVVEDK